MKSSWLYEAEDEIGALNILGGNKEIVPLTRKTRGGNLALQLDPPSSPWDMFRCEK